MPSAAEFLSFADILPDAVILVHPDGQVLGQNRSAKTTLGVSAAKTLEDLCSDPLGEVAAYLRTCARVRTPLPGSLTLRGGAKHSVYGAVLQPRTRSEQPLIALRIVPGERALSEFTSLKQKIAALNRAIHEQRRTEAEVRRQREWLRVTLRSIGDAVIATDINGHVMFMNPVAQWLTGWTEDEAVGQPIDEVFRILNEASREPCANPITRALSEGVVVGLANHTLLLSRSGIEWPIDDSAAPIRDDDGEVVGAVLVFHEIRDRRRLEDLARQRLEELVAADRRKDEFLATLAHELRNPLAPIMTATALLALPDGGVNRHERARSVIHRQVQQLSRLVDDLLDVSRITRGNIELRQRKGLDVATIIDHALETSRPIIDASGHELTLDVAPGVAFVDGDPTRLEQVVCNLLNNAAKYTPRGGKISVSAKVSGAKAELRIRDTGIGITADLLPHVFDSFVQGARSLDRAQGGLGIGLTLVKKLVTLHGGSCSCSSKGEGLGAEFVVRLPLSADQVRSVTSEGASTSSASKRRVLVVDDNRDGAEQLATYLELSGHMVFVAHDGLTAIELFRIERPDVAIIDIGLPGIDGFEVARRLCKFQDASPCVLVALTGYGQEHDRQLALEAGFSHHLLKPMAPDAIAELLTRL